MPPPQVRKCLIRGWHAVAFCNFRRVAAPQRARGRQCDPARAGAALNRASITWMAMRMNRVARQTLSELRSLRNIETYLRTAKAELASDPCDDTLRAFIGIVEALLREETAKLTAG